eukprot:15455732-Alexandrium_andersonii.AAC.1
MDRSPGLLKWYPGDKNTLMLWLRESVEEEVMEGMRQLGTAAKQTARQAVHLHMQESAGAGAAAGEEASPSVATSATPSAAAEQR